MDNIIIGIAHVGFVLWFVVGLKIGKNRARKKIEALEKKNRELWECHYDEHPDATSIVIKQYDKNGEICQHSDITLPSYGETMTDDEKKDYEDS